MTRTSNIVRRRAGLTRGDVIFGLAVLFAAAAGAGGYYFFWFQTRPQYRFQAALEAVRDRDVRAIRAEIMRLEDEPAYESHFHYLTGMYRLMTAKTSTEMRDAGVALDLAIELNDGDTRVRARAALAEVLFRLGQQIDAEKMALSVLEEDPQNTDALRVVSSVYFELGAYDEALQNLLYWGSIDRDDVHPNYVIGQIYRNRGSEQADLDLAEANFREGIARLDRKIAREKNRTESEQYANRDLRDEMSLALAETLIKKNAVQAALEECEHFSLEDGSTNLADCLATKAQCLHQVSRGSEAVPLLDRCLKIAPNHLGGLLLKAEIDAATEDYQSARALLLKATAKHPNSHSAHYQLQQVYSALGELDKAKEQETVVKNLETLLKQQGELNLKAGLNPKDPEVRFELGNIARKIGEIELAVSWYRATLVLAPDHAGAKKAMQEMQKERTAMPGLAPVGTFATPDE